MSKKSDDLKPCFCKGNAVIEERGDSLRIRCDGCGATSSKHYFITEKNNPGADAGRKRKHAIYVWNMRLSHAAA